MENPQDLFPSCWHIYTHGPNYLFPSCALTQLLSLCARSIQQTWWIMMRVRGPSSPGLVCFLKRRQDQKLNSEMNWVEHPASLQGPSSNLRGLCRPKELSLLMQVFKVTWLQLPRLDGLFIVKIYCSFHHYSSGKKDEDGAFPPCAMWCSCNTIYECEDWRFSFVLLKGVFTFICLSRSIDISSEWERSE